MTFILRDTFEHFLSSVELLRMFPFPRHSTLSPLLLTGLMDSVGVPISFCDSTVSRLQIQVNAAATYKRW